jgi:hypothetical protein
MTFQAWQRWGALSGALSAILFVIFMVVIGNDPDDNNSAIAAYYEKHSHQTSALVGLFLFIACMLVLLVFLAYLRGVLIEAEGPGGSLTTLAFASGVATVILLLVAGAMFSGPAITANDEGSKFVLDPNTWRLVNDTGYIVWVIGVMMAIPLVVVTSLVALRAAVLPRWFAWIGLVVALTLVVAFMFIPIFILFGWVLLASVLLAWWLPKRRGVVATPATAAP